MQDLKEKLSGLTLEEKIEFLEKCENKETNETLSYQLGICYFMLDDNNKALIWLKKTLALNDNHTDALKCIEAIKAQFELRKKRESSKNIALLEHPNLKKLYHSEKLHDTLELIDICINKLHIEEAHDITLSLYKDNPNNIHCLLQYAIVERELGNYKNSLDILFLVSKYQKDNIQASIEFIRTYIKTYDLDMSLLLFEKIKQKLEYNILLELEAGILQLNGKFVQASKLLNQIDSFESPYHQHKIFLLKIENYFFSNNQKWKQMSVDAFKNHPHYPEFRYWKAMQACFHKNYAQALDLVDMQYYANCFLRHHKIALMRIQVAILANRNLNDFVYLLNNFWRNNANDQMVVASAAFLNIFIIEKLNYKPSASMRKQLNKTLLRPMNEMLNLLLEMEDWQKFKHISFFIGMIYEFIRKDYQIAIAHYQKCLEKLPEHGLALERLANCYSLNNQHNKAKLVSQRLQQILR